MTATDAERRRLLIFACIASVSLFACATGDREALGGGAGGGAGGGSTSTTNSSTAEVSSSTSPWIGDPAPADCPPTEPGQFSPCPGDLTNRVCAYGSIQCTCGGVWACNECPPEPPPDGGTCPVPNAFCAYGFLSCGCSNPNSSTAPGEWICPTCPDAPPVPDEPCGGLYMGLSCSYGDALCICIEDGWLCDAPCPAEPPLRGTACVDAGQTCVYDAVECVCANGEYFCN
jgi:hypothetical protein